MICNNLPTTFRTQSSYSKVYYPFVTIQSRAQYHHQRDKALILHSSLDSHPHPAALSQGWASTGVGSFKCSDLKDHLIEKNNLVFWTSFHTFGQMSKNIFSLDHVAISGWFGSQKLLKQKFGIEKNRSSHKCCFFQSYKKLSVSQCHTPCYECEWYYI